jgi:hypothetical protein
MKDRFIRTQARWYTDKAQALKDVGVEIPEGEYKLKDILINLDNIAYIENYQGVCYVGFSGLPEDGIITDIAYSKAEEAFGTIININFNY